MPELTRSNWCPSGAQNNPASQDWDPHVALLSVKTRCTFPNRKPVRRCVQLLPEQIISSLNPVSRQRILVPMQKKSKYQLLQSTTTKFVVMLSVANWNKLCKKSACFRFSPEALGDQLYAVSSSICGCYLANVFRGKYSFCFSPDKQISFIFLQMTILREVSVEAPVGTSCMNLETSYWLGCCLWSFHLVEKTILTTKAPVNFVLCRWGWVWFPWLWEDLDPRGSRNSPFPMGVHWKKICSLDL